jgi:hypothetical protein
VAQLRQELQSSAAKITDLETELQASVQSMEQISAAAQRKQSELEGQLCAAPARHCPDPLWDRDSTQYRRANIPPRHNACSPPPRPSISRRLFLCLSSFMVHRV